MLKVACLCELKLVCCTGIVPTREVNMLKVWMLLILSICMEVTGTSCIKMSAGFTKLLPTVGVFVLYGLSFWGLAVVVKNIDLSTAYAVWSGLGTALVALVGIMFFGDHVTGLKVLSIGLIIAGVIGLNMAGGSS